MPAPITGQVNLSASAQPLSATPIESSAYSIKASAYNGGPAYIGNAGVTASTGHELAPGETQDYERNNQSGQPRFQINIADWYAVGTSGDKITWVLSP